MRGIQNNSRPSRKGPSFLATFAVGESLHDDQVVLARATAGMRLCCEGGYERIPAYEACACVGNLSTRQMLGLRDFVASERLVQRPLTSLSDPALLSLIYLLLQTQELVALRQGDVGGEATDVSLVEQRRLVRDIEKRTRGLLVNSGRRFKLVAGADLDRLMDRDSLEVVDHDTADRVLGAIVTATPGDTTLGELLGKARTKLARDWRLPFQPEGLVLLRRLVVQQATRPRDEAPITPSQMAGLLKKKTWIEIEVLHKDGTPYAGPCLLKHPDGSTTEAFLNPDGFWGSYEIDEGSFTFTVPSASAAAAQEGPDETDETDRARRVRLLGMIFDANKCFLLPPALSGLKTIIAMHEEDPGAQVLIVGHAGGDEDLAGSDIALDRAQILGAYLKSQPNLWLNWFGPDKKPRSRWGTREVQLMLSALPEGEAPFYDGFASGQTDEKTAAALKAFQASKGLPTNGTADFQTRKALVEAYMAIEDTTLAKDITPVAHGCEGHLEDTPAESGEPADDRRIEVFFFKKSIDPLPDKTVSSPDSQLYPGWLAKLVETRDYETHGIHVQIVDSVKQPCPFATVHLKGPISADSTTDAYGYVSFFGLKQGDYTISSEMDGYKIGVSKLSYPTAKTVPGHAKAT